MTGCPVTYDLNRYLAEQGRAERLTERAEELTTESRAAAVKEYRGDDMKLGEAVEFWLGNSTVQERTTRLGLAIRASLGETGGSANRQYLDEILTEACTEWAHVNAREYDENDVAGIEQDERDSAREAAYEREYARGEA